MNDARKEILIYALKWMIVPLLLLIGWLLYEKEYKPKIKKNYVISTHNGKTSYKIEYKYNFE